MLLNAAVEAEEKEEMFNDQELSSEIYIKAIDIHSNNLHRQISFYYLTETH